MPIAAVSRGRLMILILPLLKDLPAPPPPPQLQPPTSRSLCEWWHGAVCLLPVLGLQRDSLASARQLDSQPESYRADELLMRRQRLSQLVGSSESRSTPTPPRFTPPAAGWRGLTGTFHELVSIID